MSEELKKEIEKLKKKLEEAEKLKEEYLISWQRARADLLNYKREEAERILDLIKKANINLLSKFFPILDNFEMAEKKIPEDLKENENVKGLLLIKTQIKDFLKSQGIEEIEVKIGEKFDPNWQEVVEEVEREGEESGTVVEEVQKGYKIEGKILRPAKVKVVK
jgi:molecular chaperone GrpE